MLKQGMMNKQKPISMSGNSRKGTTTQDRYYVQSITEQIFVIREHTSTSEGTGQDHIIKSFDTRHDAYAHADVLNEQQRKLDTEKQEG
jgi:hypothetical protein